MPETAAGRALWGMFREKPAKSINEGPALVLAIEAEARALGRAEALAIIEDHWPGIAAAGDDSTWLDCPCGWDQSEKGAIDWNQHLVNAVEEATPHA